jgi:hypothetical protein
MALQRVRYVGRHTAGIDVPVDKERSSEVHVAHHGEVEVDERLARELIKRGDFNPVKQDPPKKADTAKKSEDG